MSTHNMLTTINWMEGEDERELEVVVTFTGHKGHPGDLIDPPEPASVEILNIVAVADTTTRVPDSFFDSDDLRAECMQHWEEEAELEADAKFEQYRERLAEKDWLP